MSDDLTFQTSFIMGEEDWVRVVDDDYGNVICKNQKKYDDEKLNGKYMMCPTASHQMHMYNPKAFANLVINDLLGTNFPILPSTDYLKSDSNMTNW